MSLVDDRGITRLHTRAIGPGGTPAMTHRFLNHLDRRTEGEGVRPGTPAVPLTIPEAWGRLRVDHPPLAAAVQATVVHKLTVRAAAPVLGCSFKMVALRKNSGLAQLVVWTNLPEHDVARHVGKMAL